MLNRWDAHLWPPLRYGSAISRSLVTFECRSRCSGRSMTRVTRSIRSPISRGPGRGSPSEGVEQLHTELRDELALRQQMGDLCWRLGRASQAFRHSLDRFDHKVRCLGETVAQEAVWRLDGHPGGAGSHREVAGVGGDEVGGVLS